ncbi:MAG: APC family permease [Polyangiaceae bacterium]|nr:APC family permease [Polyangiaceae bacterium]
MSLFGRIRRAVLGAPKDVKDPHAFHKLSLIALLAWVGLGADGLSSSSYGPDEAFKALQEHTGLAVFLAVAAALTVFIISYGYSRIIEEFPAGGGGYVVATKLLGPKTGVVSGAALLVDYVLTIAVSVSAGADAIFSFLPPHFQAYKFPFALTGLALLTLLNLRGVKESVTTIAPVFGIFVLTHVVLLLVVLVGNAANLPVVSAEVSSNIQASARELGTFGVLALFARAYSLGGGTYTGIEAVSNGIGIMREPRVATAKRTMVLMATSLAITAGGLLLCYLLVGARPEAGKTMNAVLLDRVTADWTLGGWHFGGAFNIVTLVSEGALLFVAAQAGFIDGPRVMANMATDSWLPHRFAALSERLTMRNGVVLMGGAAAAALLYAHETRPADATSDVGTLVVMYSINVFLTFSLSNIAMCRLWIGRRRQEPKWRRHLPAHLVAVLLCLTILVVTVIEKFVEGGWVTLVVTSALVVFCFFVKRHYGRVVGAIRRLDHELPDPMRSAADLRHFGHEAPPALLGPPHPDEPVAVLFVGGYGGLGRHALLTLQRMFPGHFDGVVFVSVAVVDSDVFKGTRELEALEARTQQHLASYEQFAAVLGLRATTAYSVGTEVAVEAEKLALELVGRFPKALVVAGQIIFDEDTSWNRMLHNETAFQIQRRLQHAAVPMVVLPVQLDLVAPRAGVEHPPRTGRLLARPSLAGPPPTSAE